MSQDDDRPSAMLGSRDERIQSYFRTVRSTDDIVREVTTAFASDVARIMASIHNKGDRTGREQLATSADRAISRGRASTSADMPQSPSRSSRRGSRR